MNDLIGKPPNRRMDLGEERRAVCAEVVDDRRLGRFTKTVKQGEAIGEIEGNAAIALAEGLQADPDDLTGGAERVEVAGAVLADARGENLALEDRCRERIALHGFDRVQQGFEPV